MQDVRKKPKKKSQKLEVLKIIMKKRICVIHNEMKKKKILVYLFKEKHRGTKKMSRGSRAENILFSARAVLCVSFTKTKLLLVRQLNSTTIYKKNKSVWKQNKLIKTTHFK